MLPSPSTSSLSACTPPPFPFNPQPLTPSILPLLCITPVLYQQQPGQNLRTLEEQYEFIARHCRAVLPSLAPPPGVVPVAAYKNGEWVTVRRNT
jgi:hypothetical protein